MKSRKKILAGMVAMALGSGAYAATFEGRLACDQDPREAATSCMLFVPVTDTVGLPVYTQQISVTHLLEPRGAAAAGMESETQASSEISASAPITESEPVPQASASYSESSGVYPKSEVAEGPPPFDEERERQASSKSRPGIFSWLTGEHKSGISSSDRSRDLAATSLMESDTPTGEHEQASSSSRIGIFSWLTGERRASSSSEQPVAASEPSSDQLVASESSSEVTLSESAASEPASPVGDNEVQASSSSSGGLFSWLKGERGSGISSSDPRSRDLAATSLTESDTPTGEHEQVSSSSPLGIFSWLTGERSSSSTSEQPAEVAAQESSPDHLAMTDSDSDADRTAN